MKSKITKQSRNLLIAMILGDGCATKRGQFMMTHGECQLEYLTWKVKLLENNGVRHGGIKIAANHGFGEGKNKAYVILNVLPFTKLLRRIMYKPKKSLANRKLLNRLDALGLAIWYMDDGGISFRKTGDRVHGFYIKISTYCSKEECQVLIDYFKEVWDINFYTHKHNNMFNLMCGTKEGIKFISIVKPYVEEVSSMLYKVSYDLSQRKDFLGTLNQAETGNTVVNSEDIV